MHWAIGWLLVWTLYSLLLLWVTLVLSGRRTWISSPSSPGRRRKCLMLTRLWTCTLQRRRRGKPITVVRWRVLWDSASLSMGLSVPMPMSELQWRTRFVSMIVSECLCVQCRFGLWQYWRGEQGQKNYRCSRQSSSYFWSKTVSEAILSLENFLEGHADPPTCCVVIVTLMPMPRCGKRQPSCLQCLHAYSDL